MQIFDVISWLPKKEIDIDELKTIFMKSFECVKDNTYEVVYDISGNVGENIINASDELIDEGKLVAYIKREDIVVAIVGYKY